MGNNYNAFALQQSSFLLHLSEDLVNNGPHGLDGSLPLTVRAGFSHDRCQVVPDSFAGHLNQSQFRYLKNCSLGAVAFQSILEGSKHFPPVRISFHIDEINYDEPTDVAQLDLIDNLVYGLHVGLDNSVFKVSLSHEPAGIDVYCSQCLGLVDHQVAAGFQPDLFPQRPIQLKLYTKSIEDRLIVLVKSYCLAQVGHESLGEIQEFFILAL